MRRAGLLLCSVLAVCAAGPALAQPIAPPRAAPAAASPLAAGLQAAAASDYVAAEKALLAIIATQSSDRAAALGALARVRLEQGRFDEADKLALQAAGSPDQRLVATALRGEDLAAERGPQAPHAQQRRARGRRTARPPGARRAARSRRAPGGRRANLAQVRRRIRERRHCVDRRRGPGDGRPRDASPPAPERRQPRLQRERARRDRGLAARRDAPVARRALLRHLRSRARRGDAARGTQDGAAPGRRERAPRAGEARGGVRLRRRREAREGGALGESSA